uniref:Uncharacterized protein n=1 Tax=Parascaris equorum TaxID=6256 RepID=A0A914RDI0_PAREQ
MYASIYPYNTYMSTHPYTLQLIPARILHVISCTEGKQGLDPGITDDSIRFLLVEINGDAPENLNPTQELDDGEMVEWGGEGDACGMTTKEGANALQPRRLISVYCLVANRRRDALCAFSFANQIFFNVKVDVSDHSCAYLGIDAEETLHRCYLCVRPLR